ncbi:DEAD/DEAH box helicase [uncultured Ruminococcus sp.]|uniref:DEAD/DEAH box helicase n=1 Tax=uncultured Ruminococcus sp. TaxID=165186 RepID=UPI0025E3DD71|nr:DEAD/DEAH box helicase [uncultured Ruminococcus sp.]
MELKAYFKNNPSMLLSEKNIYAIFSDLYMNDQLKINLMLNAFRIGIIDDMRDKYPVDQVTITRWAKKLVNDYGVSNENAHWAIKNWISVIDQDLLNKLNIAEKLVQKEQEEQQLKQKEEAKLLALEEIKRLEEEQQAKEKAKRLSPDSRLKTKEDYNDYYINPSYNKSNDYIYVPCGFGGSDNGFFIYGIQKKLSCTHRDANVYALVYNYLIRNSTITENDIPTFLKNIDSVYEIDFQSVFRLAITLLLLIRHNYISDIISLHYTEDKESLSYAVKMINHYAALFCRLIGIPIIKLQCKIDKNGIPLSLHDIKGIHIKDNTKLISNARELWYGRKINYHLTKDNLNDLEFILHEISNFDSFKEGQFSALCDMLACKKHSVCIMPTGSGKSLIFYLASLLQPLPLFIVSPTDILIQDQIRNLKAFHRIDNVAHLMLTNENSFENWEICNSLNYITPMTFQNRHLLAYFRCLNSGTNKKEDRIAQGALVSYIILDEIHCLSNWGHDFRPEYLMLSKYLNKFFDHISFWGFTATADYTVVEDVQRQLNIPQDNFFSPIAFEHYNVSYDYRVFHDEEAMLKEVANITNSILSRNERAIVFTKNDEISKKVADSIGWEADIFLKDNPSAYYYFAEGKSKILVASDELGIGINLPNISNVIHFGLPLSKNEYVQEIGRAGRAHEKVKSYILYLDQSIDNVPKGLLKRDTPINNLSTLLNSYDNDYKHIFKKLSNGAISNHELFSQLLHMYRELESCGRPLTVNSYSFDKLEKTKQLLYMLYLVGYVNDWYSYSCSKDNNGVDILIDICSTDAHSYKENPAKMLNRMKKRSHDYFEYMGNNREGIAKVERANTPNDIIHVYVNWYYEHYLYHHKEQFLDFYEFIGENHSCDSDKITEEIKDFFILPFAKLKSDEALYNELSLKEIIAKTINGVGKNTLVNLERINSNRYSYKLDLALFCGQLRMNDVFDESRLRRIASKLPVAEIIQLCNALSSLYPFCKLETKISIFKFMENQATLLHTTYNDFLSSIYKNEFKDELYYYIVAKRLNKNFVQIRRRINV